MEMQGSNFYSYSAYSEVYKKLFSLKTDIRNSYQYDRDETDSIKEIIEIIKSILIMASLEEYFSDNQTDLNYFMGEFSKDVLTYILHQSVVYGDNGHDLALDLLIHFIKLFFKFHKNKEYSTLFENIRKIFDISQSYYNPEHFQRDKDKVPKKYNTYKEFNEEFCSKFQKEEKFEKKFKVGDKIDFLIYNNETCRTLDKKTWIRGEIKEVNDENYIIQYPKNSFSKEVKIPINSKRIKELGSMTSDWDWRLNLKKFDLVDCFDREKWYPATVCEIKDYQNTNGVYKEYKIGFRLYPEKFLENKEYDYDTFVSNMVFWDNNNNSTDKEGNSFIGDFEHCDEYIPFYSKRIQKFQTYSTIQKEILSNQLNQLNQFNQYNQLFGNNNGQNNISFQAQGNQNEERIKLITDLLSYERDGNSEDEMFYYEKDGKKNYIIGRNSDEFKYYYALLLKKMEEEGMYDEIISFLKDKPNMVELYNIFYILEKSDKFLHADFFKENKELFKNAFLDTIEGLTSKEMKILQKEFIDYSLGFLSRVDYLLSGEKNPKKNDVRFELSIKLIKSSIFDKKIQGLKMLSEFIKTKLETEEKNNIINVIKKNNLIKELFGSNYHTQIIKQSNDIVEFMLKNNELTEDDIKLIWSLTEQSDLEAKMTIIKLLSDLKNYLNQKLSNVILNSINVETIINFSENEIDLIKNLAINANNKIFISKCCEIFFDKILEIKNLNTLEKSTYVNMLSNFFEKDEICCKRIIEICESNLKENKNVLNILFLLEKIIIRNKKKICSENKNEIVENDFIYQEINKLIDNNKLLILFEDNFKSYKNRAKEEIKNGKPLLIDGYNHQENMNHRITFLIKVIPILYPKFDFFSFLKEICLEDPIFENDKSFFYDFMEKYINELNKNIIEDSSEEKIAIKEQLFNMLAKENKNYLSTSQFNLYIKLFLDINHHKNYLSFFKPNDNYIINIYNDININDIFGMDKLWDLLFELKFENLSQKLINFIYSLYENKKEIQILLDKCVNLIKDTDNITINKLKVCMNILKYIITDSEKSGIIQIKSHNNLLKDCLIYLNLEVKKNSTATYFNFNSMKHKNKNVLYGNTTINEIKQILSEKNNIEEKDITVSLKIGNINETTLLDNSCNNKNLIEIFQLNRETKRGLDSQKLKFQGNFEEKEYLTRYGSVNKKFENMLKEWFNNFTNGMEIMDKDAIETYIANIETTSPADESESLYNKLMKYDKGSKSCLLEEEFLEFYTDLAKKDEKTVWEHIKKMGYGKNLERKLNFDENEKSIKVIDKDKLPRYILGNDITFHEALLKAFNKFEDKMDIFEFLFFLSTNEKKYDELFNKYNKLIEAETEQNINYLEELYNLLIIKSFIQDLQSKKINLEFLFNEKAKKEINIFGTSQESTNKGIKIMSKNYLPFDEENNLEKKRIFLIDFIEKGGYEKLVEKIAKTLNLIKFNYLDQEKILFCKQAIELIDILYQSFIYKCAQKEIKAEDDVYFLFEKIDIIQLLSGKEEKDKDKDKEKINNLKEIIKNTNYISLVESIISFISKIKDSLNKQCFKLFLDLCTSNKKLFDQVKSDEKIKNNLYDLIKNNIINSDKFFIQILKDYIKEMSSVKQDSNKLNEEFLIYLFEISNSLFNELIINKSESNNEEQKSKSIIFFFEYFSELLKEILKNCQNENITNILKKDFISQIYNLLYNNIKEKNTKKKLPEDIFLGMMKILITIVKSNQEIKEQILTNKINNETLFDIIYNKIVPDNDKDENKEINNQNLDDDLDITNLLNQITNENDNGETNENEVDQKFVQINKLSEIIHLINSTKKEDDEEIISDKVLITYKNFIQACLTDCTKVDLILKLLKLLSSFNPSKTNYNQISTNTKKSKSKKEPKKCGYVGLKNLGCICYMNSILQQMYMVPPFRNAIISSDDKKEVKTMKSSFNNNFYDDNLLHQLQKMYTFLTFSEKQAYNPKDFCSSFKDLDGQPINILLQQDSQEFYNNFCDKIEFFLKQTKYKYIIDNIFTGKTCSSVICEKCNTVSNKFEDFYNLSLEVKNINNLYDSLKKFIEPEKIEEFNCETCKKKVTISKRTSLAKLPNVLFVHLKRFYMNYEKEGTEKINSKFEFPNTINLRDFCVEEISKIKDQEQESDVIYPKLDDYYEYELKGINVHLGSAEGGHYISFIDVERDGENNEPKIKSSIENGIIKSRWLKFNDSIVTEFNTEEIPIESYGGCVDGNINNENYQNAYLLIYERKKKTPIKIVIEKENEEKYLKNEKYNIISFPKEKRKFINKCYDISYTNFESKLKENDLYNIIFKDEEKDECYFYTPYYNIEKNVVKEIFIEVMNKNKKFFNRKVTNQIDLSKYKDKWYDILFSIINTKEFNILSDEYSCQEKKQFISYFKSEILDNKMCKNTFSLEDEQKIILNDRANILLKKILIPLVDVKDKTKEIYDLLEYIGTFLTINPAMSKIFEYKNMILTGIFNMENVKLFCEVLYKVMICCDTIIVANKKNFKDLFDAIKDIKFNKNDTTYYINNNRAYEEDDEKKNDKEISAYYYLDLINKIFKLSHEYVTCVKDLNPILKLISKLKKKNTKEIRNLIYDTVSYLLEQYYDKKIRINNEQERSNIIRKIFDEEVLKLLFEENCQLLETLLDIVQYNNKYYYQKICCILMSDFFVYAVKKDKLNQILNIFFKSINIKDQYIINRLHLLMGFPCMIIKNKKETIKEEPKKEIDRYKLDTDEEKEDEDDEDNKKEIYTIFPKCSLSLIKENKENEIYKYISTFKRHETNCILAQLFPCSDNNLFYEDTKELRREKILTEKERKDYIYKLLTMSLLGEGNYAIFKYIYLTQSRFIKYNNLYDEMIDILTKDKNDNYDLSEIKKNSEICITRINYEINKIKYNISILTEHKLKYDLNLIQSDEKPPLPENMKETNKDYEDIEEFTGFIPRYLPDKIIKVRYVFETSRDHLNLIFIHYYTTYQEREKFLEKKEEEKKEEIKEAKKEEEKIENKNEIIDESDKNKDKEIEDDDEDNERKKIYFRSKIEDNEDKFCTKLIKLRRETQGLINEIIIINDIKDEEEKKKEKLAKITFTRVILFSLREQNIFWDGTYGENNANYCMKCNYYIPDYCNGIIKKTDDILIIYRKNVFLDFIKENSIKINISTSQVPNSLDSFDDSNGMSD